MRIALLKSRLSHQGGLEKYCLRLAACLASEKHQVYILTTTDWRGPKLFPNGVKVVTVATTIPISFFHLLNFDFHCHRWLQQHAIDAVFGFDRNFTRQDYYRAGNGVHKAYLERR